MRAPIVTFADNKQELVDILNALVYFTDDKQVIRIADGVKRSVFKLGDKPKYYGISWAYPNAHVASFDTRLEAVDWMIKQLLPNLPEFPEK